MRRKNDDERFLSHARWNCQYHIVFTLKYRRKAIYTKPREDKINDQRSLKEYKNQFTGK